jgi:hypothetical protein
MCVVWECSRRGEIDCRSGERKIGFKKFVAVGLKERLAGAAEESAILIDQIRWIRSSGKEIKAEDI